MGRKKWIQGCYKFLPPYNISNLLAQSLGTSGRWVNDHHDCIMPISHLFLLLPGHRIPSEFWWCWKRLVDTDKQQRFLSKLLVMDVSSFGVVFFLKQKGDKKSLCNKSLSVFIRNLGRTGHIRKM